ncbi:DinB family protein [Paenibacillus thermotolerans]|uniref:DinB family protein n=1 Tax=Paenibacillus thermotolerans TaxID=3027807 RepID=UPI002368B2CF|nr:MULTISPECIES: DinB family protein [unclassified Paenibacillus]
MSVVEDLLEELRREALSTRRILERIPEARMAWKPHPKSMSLGQLALHTAGLPGGLAMLLNVPVREVPIVPLPEAATVSEILAVLDEQVAVAQQVFCSWSDEYVRDTFRLAAQGTIILETPRLELVRTLLFNRWHHHRGQLTVYLRLLDVPVPGIYGPSADE